MRLDGIKGEDPTETVKTLEVNGVDAVFFLIPTPTDPEEMEVIKDLRLRIPQPTQFHLWLPVYRNARYLETHPEDVFVITQGQTEPGWISPTSQGYRTYLVEEIGRLTDELNPDGIFLDYFYVPYGPFDNSTLDAFSEEIGQQVGEENVTKDSVLLGQFLEWRNEWIIETLQAVRSATGDLRLSVFVILLQESDRLARGQDVEGFAKTTDFLVPNSYHFEALREASWVGGSVAALRASGADRIWTGIQAYNIPPKETAKAIKSAVNAGADGVILFRYGTMREEHWARVVRALEGPDPTLYTAVGLSVVFVSVALVWRLRSRRRNPPPSRRRRRR